LRRLVGGVDTVRDDRLGRPVCTTRGSVSSDRKGSVCSALFCCADCSFSALDNRLLVSAEPTDKGYSDGGRSGIEATGSDSGAAVSSVILEADNRRMPSPLPVLDCVPDRLRDLVALSPCPPSRGACSASMLDIADSLDASTLLVLSLGVPELETTSAPFGVCAVAQGACVPASGGSSGHLETVTGGGGVGSGDGYAFLDVVASSTSQSNPSCLSFEICDDWNARDSHALVVPVDLVAASSNSGFGAVSKTASSYLVATSSIAYVVKCNSMKAKDPWPSRD
jgi:hypothetical protein